jgi:hypothetical protein
VGSPPLEKKHSHASQLDPRGETCAARHRRVDRRIAKTSCLHRHIEDPAEALIDQDRGRTSSGPSLEKRDLIRNPRGVSAGDSASRLIPGLIFLTFSGRSSLRRARRAWRGRKWRGVRFLAPA